jgi:hypothetical protein
MSLNTIFNILTFQHSDILHPSYKTTDDRAESHFGVGGGLAIWLYDFWGVVGRGVDQF